MGLKNLTNVFVKKIN